VNGAWTSQRERIFAAGLFAVCLAALMLLSACGAQTPRPNLAVSYEGALASPDRTPLILIPGLFGSKLRRASTGEEIWPGSWYKVLFSDYRDLALEDSEPGVEAFDLAEQVLGVDYYKPLLETLVRFGGYVRTQPGTAPPTRGRALYVFPYDWRRDNALHAVELERLIQQIRVDHHDPRLKVDLVAHSMGAIVARYYLRFGPRDVLGGDPGDITLYGTEHVRKLVLLGAPNFGAVSALEGMIGGESIGFGRIAPEVVATMPSVYQLLPHPLAEWLVDTGGRPVDADLYQASTWREFRMGIFSREATARSMASPSGARLEDRQFSAYLERARRLAWMLSTPEPRSPIRYVLFGGNCEQTPARLRVLEIDGVKAVEGPSALMGVGALSSGLLEPGDGRVTKASLLARETLDPSAPQHEEAFLPLAYYFFLCERHDRLTSNVNFQDNLLHILLTPQLPWDVRPVR
jgi:pimeloyl-ACP methyl ester carboxylesterase